MRVDMSDEAAVHVRAHGGGLWVWAAYPRLRCCGMQAWMHATTDVPADVTGFSPLPADGVQLRFRRLGSREPAVLQIALHGRHRPQVEAYWDGCLFVL
jgi:hypothetical protein